MSQHNSSMVSNSGQNSEIKYQKALKEISKLINTNKVLKNQCEERQQVLGAQLSDIAMRFEELSKKYQELQQEKMRADEFIEELQDTNADLRKQYQTIERQVGYLNDVLTQQNAELKKVSAFKDSKGISDLFSSYEQKENNYKKDILRLQEHVSQLKDTIDTLEADIVQQRQMRVRYQEQYNILSLDINKYRDLNSYLMNQNEAILNGLNKDSGYSRHKELETFFMEFQRQLQNLRGIKYQREDVGERQYEKNYELLLEEKNQMSMELARTRDQLEIAEKKVNELYQMQQKMSSAVSKCQVLLQQNNMLKNRITILESKDILDNAGFQDDSEIKEFEEKINFMINKQDPLSAIKNSDDNTHFITMKSFIADLQTKLQKKIVDHQNLTKKYEKIKIKFSKVAEEKFALEDSNKLLKGKLEGYERLTEKLHYQLERSMHAHEDEVVKMVAITNNLVSKKVQESKNASTFIKSQFDVEIEKYERLEKTLTQQVETLKLENSTQRIRITDLEDKLRVTNEFSQLHKNKLKEVENRYRQLSEENSRLNEKIQKLQQLYNEQKVRNEALLLQKQSLSSKVNILTEQISQKSYKLEEKIQQLENNHTNVVRKLKSQNSRLQNEHQFIIVQNKKLNRQLNERKQRENSILGNFRNEDRYYSELETNYHDLRQKNQTLQTQVLRLRNSASKLQSVEEYRNKLENQFNELKEKIGQEQRSLITLKKENQELSISLDNFKEENTQLSKQLKELRQNISQKEQKNLTKNIGSKQIQMKRTIQQLKEQIAVLESQVRDQKWTVQSFSSEVNNYKQQIQMLKQSLKRTKAQEISLNDALNQAKGQIEKLQEELAQNRSKHGHITNSLKITQSQLSKANQTVAELNEEVSSLKANFTKATSKHDSLTRELSGLEFYIRQNEKIVQKLNKNSQLGWEGQKNKENISNLVQNLRRIIRNSQTFRSTDSNSAEYSFVPASSFGNFQHQRQSGQQARIDYSGSFGNDNIQSLERYDPKNYPITNDTLNYRQASGQTGKFESGVYSNEYSTQLITDSQASTYKFSRYGIKSENV